MQALARTVINLMAFLELSGDDVVDPDDAVTALENACADLQDLTAEEKAALEAALAEDRSARAASGRSPEELAFFDNFMEACGLTDESDEI